MKDKPIQWHPGFQSALQVELLEAGGNLTFEKEQNLTRKPLLIDMMIIKKDASCPACRARRCPSSELLLSLNTRALMTM